LLLAFSAANRFPLRRKQILTNQARCYEIVGVMVAADGTDSPGRWQNGERLADTT
jgi:hypothetical protein